jgi:hypothetical protein
MATKKRISTGAPECKDDPVRQAIHEGRPAQEMWALLHDLHVGFVRAAVTHESEEMAEMGRILGWLQDPKFRKDTHRLYEEQVRETIDQASEAEGLPKIRRWTRPYEESFLLGGAMVGLAHAREQSAAPATIVAQSILNHLQLCPKLRSRTTCPDGEAMERVTNKIAPQLDDLDAVNAESVVRSAMKALGCDPDYVRNMFRE